MRNCHRCHTQMIEDLEVVVEGGAYGIKIKSKGIFSKRLGKPKVAVCPSCREVSMYMDESDLNEVRTLRDK